MLSRTTRCSLVLAAIAAVGLPCSLSQAQDGTKTAPIQLKPAAAPGMPVAPAPMQPGHPSTPTPPGALPEALKLSETSFNWGDIADTDPVAHDLQFTNTSDKTITIAVAASCGCTVAQLEKNTFAPGETGKVTATFNPQGRAGSQTKTLTFTVTNPQGVFAQQMASLTANVKALVTFDPPKMYLNEVDHRKGQTAMLTITGRKPGFAITKAIPQSEFVVAKIGEARTTEVNGEKLTQVPIELEIAKGAPIGNFQTNLTLESNDDKAKIQPYYVGADVVGDVKATPPQAILRVNTPSTPFTTQVRLDSRSGSSFNLVSVDVEGGQNMQGMSVATDVTKGEEGKYYMITMSGMTPARGGMVQGYLVVASDSQGGETMKIPFTAVIRNPEQQNPAGITPVANPVQVKSPGH